MQLPDSFPEGRPQRGGLHKRSAEDKGGSCARQKQSSLGGCCLFLGALRGVPAVGGDGEGGPVLFAGAHPQAGGGRPPESFRVKA